MNPVVTGGGCTGCSQSVVLRLLRRTANSWLFVRRVLAVCAVLATTPTQQQHAKRAKGIEHWQSSALLSRRECTILNPCTHPCLAGLRGPHLPFCPVLLRTHVTARATVCWRSQAANKRKSLLAQHIAQMMMHACGACAQKVVLPSDPHSAAATSCSRRRAGRCDDALGGMCRASAYQLPELLCVGRACAW